MRTGTVEKIAACIFAAGILSGSSMAAAETEAADKSGYLLDSRGNVVRNSYNECWRTGYWTPELAIEECDPDLVKKPEPPAVVEAPPAPAMPPPPPKPVIQVKIDSSALFDFDMAVLRPEGKRMLDEQVVAQMKAHPEVQSLTIVGYADRIGTDAYNQDLSERRAAAGKAYLVEQGIPAEWITTVGKGESEPDPEANTAEVCKDVKGRDELISCLQPDRRIVIESEAVASANQ